MINVGLIGYGRYGKKYYKNLISNKNFKIIKVLRKSKKKINHIFTNSSKKFFKISNIDLYIIASPTETHYEYLKNVLDKKKHIIIEKPFVFKVNEFLKIKNKIKDYKKIILINHTDLHIKSFINIKKEINKIGKIKFVKLNYGKNDPYLLKNIKNKYNLPYFEWLPHPIAIIINLFKDQNYKIQLKERRKIIDKRLEQNLKVIFLGKNFPIEINFSNCYKIKKRNLEIKGEKSDLIYKGYNKKKSYIRKNNKLFFLKTQEVDPIRNLLNCFLLKLNKSKFNDDRKSIISSTKYLFKISNYLNI
ncbi:Gfo/Idh/MocA family oxidoreductase [Candidatus Pelagibacter sp.]|nr:Gfo/Idh/MocA family oxidoreductase [Candidatus Pelagibacter sp.]